MTRRRLERSITPVAVLLLIGVARMADADTPGLFQYLDRRDRTAIATLTDELRRGATDPRIPLALADLHLARGDTISADRALDVAESISSTSAAVQARIWRAWIEYRAGRPSQAEDTLRRIAASSPATDEGDEALFTLGWQQLLSGRHREAAESFEALEPEHDHHWLAFPDHALLLAGQARIWSGETRRAHELFDRLLVEYPRSPLADDAARDLAWCLHLEGDTAAARRRLEALAHRYGDAHYGTTSVVPVAWSRVATRGAPTMARPLFRAFRRRPRGERPLAFLLAVGDRAAARDAEGLLTLLPSGAPAADAGRTTITNLEEHARPTTAAEDRRTCGPAAARTRTQMPRMAAWVVLFLLGGLLTARRVIRALRGRDPEPRWRAPSA